MNELFERPECLPSKTYKIKIEDKPAVYITISDYEVNHGEPDAHVIPWEIFLSSKNMSEFQWMTACMRLISFVFRYAPHTVVDMIAELKSVDDPVNGNYIRKGHKGFVRSLVSDIAEQIESHMQTIGVIK